MRRIFQGLLAAATLTISGTSLAEDFSSGNALYDACKDGLNNTHRAMLFQQGLCGGIISTVADLASSQTTVESSRICGPKNATTGQELRVVMKYMDEHPAELNKPLSTIAYNALQEVWSCRLTR
jgi:Rap1a immunity proteins